MTKQEIIKQAYGEHWNKVCEYVDENGWCNSYWGKEYTDLNGVGKTKKDPLYWRPKSLQGIEDNNGWIKIKSETDLPKGGDIFYLCGKMFEDGNFVIDEMFTYNSIDKDKFTHYQPIIKPKPPIY